MKQTLSITRKELDSYFSSPMALIFVGVFLTATLFTFFFEDAFWARGLADVRPLFRWMPILLIFLVGTLTMRQWTDEQQSGTLELLLTMPLKLTQLVIGKFVAVLVLVAVALALTLVLPISVSMLGNLDVGPVIGGYVAGLLMASAYIAIGLFLSSRTDNQIVALILTVLLCGIFHMIGSTVVIDFVTDAVGRNMADVLWALSTGSRFQSIERGVIDLRDIVYYVSLTAIFLAFNVISLDSKRWSHGAKFANYRLNATALVALLTLNIIAANVLLYPLNTARADLTEDQVYSLSDVTRDILDDLDEPLLVRAYISEENHPLLEPIVPQLEDLLREYEVAADGNMTLEIVDPIDDPEIEAEANQTYGIRAVPLQNFDRAGSQILNIYFDILIRYGDETEILNFGDLIEVDQFAGGEDVQIRFRNLEYDLTSAINKTVSGFQSIDAVLASLQEPATLTLFVTPSTLPEELADAPDTIQQIAEDIAATSDGQLNFQLVDLDSGAAGITPEDLFNAYEMRPLAVDFFAEDTFYLYMLVQVGDQFEVIPPTGTVSEEETRTAIESALKRFSDGFLEVVGVWTPPAQTVDQFGQPQQSLQRYVSLQQELSANFEVQPVNLAEGQVPPQIDVLLVIAPQQLTDADLFAIDQFLMRGGQVFLAAGNYNIDVNQATGSLALRPTQGGVQDLLAHYGITVEPEIVLDPQSDVFPLQVQRGLGAVEIQLFDYPFFVDVRQDGMSEDNSIVSGLSALTLNWASPITIAEDAAYEVDVLLESTNDAWTTTDAATILPNPDLYPRYGFPVEGEQTTRALAVAVTGSFASYFADRPSPFDQPEDAPVDPNADPDAAQPFRSTLTQSPPDARLVVVGSSEFLNDTVFNLSAGFTTGESYLNNIRMVQNAVEWFNEDEALASIRARGASVRLLDNIDDSEQNRWETFNFAVALIALLVLGAVWQIRKRGEQPMPLIVTEDTHA